MNRLHRKTIQISVAMLLAIGCHFPLLGQFPTIYPERQVFLYDGLELNFRTGYDKVVPLYYNNLKDCSNAEFHCLLSSGLTAFMKVAVPKSCRKIKVGAVFVVGEITTRVVKRYKAPGPDAFLLSTSGAQQGAYRYSPAKGIDVIFWSPDKSEDVAAIIAASTDDMGDGQVSARIVADPNHAYGMCR